MRGGERLKLPSAPSMSQLCACFKKAKAERWQERHARGLSGQGSCPDSVSVHVLLC